MTTTEMFTDFLKNVAIDNSASITSKYEEITAALNKKFRNTESKTANSLQVGSYGRWTGIKGISDLDMLYIMPSSKWNDYKDGEQSKLLDDTKEAIQARYPKTIVKKDRLVVQVLYKSFTVEVQPVFEQDDSSFKYPDTYNGGSWKITKPRDEIKAMKEFVDQKNKNLRKLCKMGRAWKNKCGVGMGGLLIDTLAYNFLNSNSDYDNRSLAYYDWMCRDFFKYLSEEPNKDYYLALGSNQRVTVKSKFQRKAKKAYELSLDAINAGESSSANKKWKKIFGRPFPAAIQQESKSSVYRNTEQFIEDLYPIDIRFNVRLECEVSQNGFREALLRTMLAKKLKLQSKKKLNFFIADIDVPGEFIIKWKVLNRGAIAEQRDCVRGDIIIDKGFRKKEEKTDFNGEHIVECFVIQNDVVVAKDRIDVPIQ
ncbi:SMODS domain-containing nucleotidyltransferase [Colwellia sp. Bg11-28]|uniref:SMODS domain-containing nucleotidyltransferase n=1 Tax=Colwellia sp. Bg11-28 TaxID=2058305 RepID=UPI000C34992C|nr:nucleotidyltransferase [Colwellia sp. Bg11-28]PKH88909.1 nucleotidyltransferase [Colwellia sp. Bg11-28]